MLEAAARVERAAHGKRTPSKISPERPQRCNQIWLDPILLDRATGFPSVTSWRQCRFEKLDEKTGQLYICDTGHGRIVKLDTKAGSTTSARPIPALQNSFDSEPSATTVCSSKGVWRTRSAWP